MEIIKGGARLRRLGGGASCSEREIWLTRQPIFDRITKIFADSKEIEGGGGGGHPLTLH